MRHGQTLVYVLEVGDRDRMVVIETFEVEVEMMEPETQSGSRQAERDREIDRRREIW